MMILVLAIGGGLGWLTHITRIARAQREVVAAVESAGALAFYEWQYVNGEIDTEAEAPAPKWVFDRVGVDYF
jgi:hypothetical protein